MGRPLYDTTEGWHCREDEVRWYIENGEWDDAAARMEAGDIYRMSKEDASFIEARLPTTLRLAAGDPGEWHVQEELIVQRDRPLPVKWMLGCLCDRKNGAELCFLHPERVWS